MESRCGSWGVGGMNRLWRTRTALFYGESRLREYRVCEACLAPNGPTNQQSTKHKAQSRFTARPTQRFSPFATLRSCFRNNGVARSGMPGDVCSLWPLLRHYCNRLNRLVYSTRVGSPFKFSYPRNHRTTCGRNKERQYLVGVVFDYSMGAIVFSSPLSMRSTRNTCGRWTQCRNLPDLWRSDLHLSK